MSGANYNYVVDKNNNYYFKRSRVLSAGTLLKCLLISGLLLGPGCGPGFALGTEKPWRKIAEKGDLLYQKRAYHAAASVYKQAVDMNNDNWQLHLRYGRALSRIGRSKEALAELFQVLFLNDKEPLLNVPARAEIAAILLKQGNYDEAGGQLKQILELNPEDMDVRGNYAVCLERLGFIELAVEEFNLVARARPNSSVAFYNLGNALFKKGDFERAKLSFKRSIGLNPNNYLAIVALGRSHMAQEENQLALIVLKKAVERNPSNHYAYLALGELYENTGAKGDALEAYKKAIQISPRDPASKAALSKLLDNSKSLVAGDRLKLMR